MVKTSADSLADQIRALGERVRGGLLPLTDAVCGPAGTPTALASPLGLDLATASRVLKALRTPDPAAVLSYLPSPQGLDLLIGAAKRARVDPDLCSAAEHAVNDLRRFFNAVPGGRRAINTAIAGWLPDTRRREETGAKQQSYQSVAFLVGLAVDAALVVDIISPSPDRTTTDVLVVHCWSGLRRLRESQPIAVLGFELTDPDTDGPRWLRMSGKEPITSPEDLFIAGFCSDPLPRFECIAGDDRHHWLILPGDEPDVTDAITLTTGYLAHGTGPLYRTDAERITTDKLLVRLPTKVLLWDTLVREDLYGGAPPLITPRLFGQPIPYSDPGDPAFRVDALDLSCSVESLGSGLSRLGCRELPRYEELLRSAFEQTGWDSRRFRAYRCRHQYSLPFVQLERNFQLPTRVGATPAQP